MKTKVVLVPLILMCGCDFIGEKKEEQQRAQQELELARAPAQAAEARRVADERRQAEAARYRQDVVRFATGKMELVKPEAEAAERRREEIRADAAELSRICAEIMREKDAKGEDLNYESKVLHVLRNERVNELAVKYLACDFSTMTAEFIDRVRKSRKGDAIYEKAVSQRLSQFDANVKATESWQGDVQAKFDMDVARLRREIADLEGQLKAVYTETRDSARKSIAANLSNEREREDRKAVLEQKHGDIQRRITAKREQLDRLLHPSNEGRLQSTAMDNMQYTQRKAQAQLEQALADINRQLKPKSSTMDVAVAYEKSTVGALRQKIALELKAEDDRVEAMRKRIRALQEVLLAIPSADDAELRKIRASLAAPAEK